MTKEDPNNSNIKRNTNTIYSGDLTEDALREKSIQHRSQKNNFPHIRGRKDIGGRGGEEKKKIERKKKKRVNE